METNKLGTIYLKSVCFVFCLCVHNTLQYITSATVEMLFQFIVTRGHLILSKAGYPSLLASTVFQLMKRFSLLSNSHSIH